ncbi:MAG: 2-C-methyl-D-erythritol 4-phosphate cytidylyltransferase [Bacteroidia bacterium]|nr:MAG: 2-C-methyl-D-erythritol 4-phosphate cytidylyltransferase [Bacteroidia bacterium]
MNLYSNIKLVIVSGGMGKRMGKNIPKQFLSINRKPIIIHTIERFLEIFPPSNIIIVIKENQIPQLNTFLQEYNIHGISIALGGEHRTDSVRNGLQTIKNQDSQFSGYVLIHDAVRPFVKKDFLEQFIKKLYEKQNLITTCPVKNSLRRITEKGTQVVNREEYLEVQTPQGFLFQEIYEAYINSSQTFFDDASLYEHYYQKPVYNIDYIPENIKITTVVDLILADYLSQAGF